MKKGLIESGSKNYVNQFLKYEKGNPSDIIEIHNRPNYFHMIHQKKHKQKIILGYGININTKFGNTKIEIIKNNL